jgi:hypothetical protein
MSIDISREHATLVVDREYGDEARGRARLGPLWVIGSPKNIAVIKELWEAGETYDANSPTYFDDLPQRSLEDSAVAFIGTVDTHHPDWTSFEIIGVPCSRRLIEALLECAVGSAVETPTGLVFQRENSQQETK